jgi:hypothetical protein
LFSAKKLDGGVILMKKTLNINTGMALLLSDQTDALSGFDSVAINAGLVIASRKAYDKLIGMGVSINSGSMNIIDVVGEIVELAGNTVITASMTFGGCYILCDGNLVIEDAKGLSGITGIYAKRIFNPNSVDLSAVKGITAQHRFIYPDGAKLHLGSIALGDDAHIILESSHHWVHGTITALDSGALEKLLLKGASFQCGKLIIHAGHYERFSDMFKAENFVFIPDGHTFVGETTLDAATSVLHGDKLFVYGDLMIPHDQALHLSGFSSLIVKGTATMPVSAAKDFKACGKADDYDMYEGVLMKVNGTKNIDHEQLQFAISMGIVYTMRVNGILAFLDDVTAEDTGAIASIDCNGLVYAPGKARGPLASKLIRVNGEILDIGQYGNEQNDAPNGADEGESYINAGNYRM